MRSGSSVSSESTIIVYLPREASMPILRACEAPPLCVCMAVMRRSDAAMSSHIAGELSVEPSSTMIISDSSGGCGRMLSTHRRRYVPVL